MDADLKDRIGGVARDIYLRANPATFGRCKCYVQLRARPRGYNDRQMQAREAETGVIDGDRRNRRAGLSGIRQSDGLGLRLRHRHGCEPQVYRRASELPRRPGMQWQRSADQREKKSRKDTNE